MISFLWGISEKIGQTAQIEPPQLIWTPDPKILDLPLWDTLKYEPPHDKTNKMTVHPAKTQISLGIHPVCSESSLCAQWVAKDPSFLHKKN